MGCALLTPCGGDAGCLAHRALGSLGLLPHGAFHIPVACASGSGGPDFLGLVCPTSGPTLVQQFCAFPLLGGWAASALRPCGESLGSCAGGWSSLTGPTVFGVLCAGGPNLSSDGLDPPAACGALPGSCPACLVVQCAGGPLFVGCSPGLRIEPLALRGALSCHGPEGLRYWRWGRHAPLTSAADRGCAMCPCSNLSTGGPRRNPFRVAVQKPWNDLMSL